MSPEDVCAHTQLHEEMTNDALEVHRLGCRSRKNTHDLLVGGGTAYSHSLPWFADCGEGRKEVVEGNMFSLKRHGHRSNFLPPQT
jgi:hypothetical protein